MLQKKKSYFFPRKLLRFCKVIDFILLGDQGIQSLMLWRNMIWTWRLSVNRVLPKPVWTDRFKDVDEPKLTVLDKVLPCKSLNLCDVPIAGVRQYAIISAIAYRKP
jgi:hypothetical protein